MQALHGFQIDPVRGKIGRKMELILYMDSDRQGEIDATLGSF